MQCLFCVKILYKYEIYNDEYILYTFKIKHFLEFSQISTQLYIYLIIVELFSIKEKLKSKIFENLLKTIATNL